MKPSWLEQWHSRRPSRAPLSPSPANLAARANEEAALTPYLWAVPRSLQHLDFDSPTRPPIAYLLRLPGTALRVLIEGDLRGSGAEVSCLVALLDSATPSLPLSR